MSLLVYQNITPLVCYCSAIQNTRVFPKLQLLQLLHPVFVASETILGKSASLSKSITKMILKVKMLVTQLLHLPQKWGVVIVAFVVLKNSTVSPKKMMCS